jgi:hypothetical protein
MIREYVVNGTTDDQGAATVDTPTTVRGELLAVFVEGIALTNGADLVVTTRMPLVAGTVGTGETLVNHGDVGNATMNTLYPRRFAHTVAGADIEVATGQKVTTPFVIPGCVLRAVIAAGGDTVSFRITYVVRG